MRSLGALAIFLALVCHLGLSLRRNYRGDQEDEKIHFPSFKRHGKTRTESGVRYVRPRPLEPFDSSEVHEDGDFEERQLLNLLRRIYEERELTEKELGEDEGLFFSW